MHKLNIDDDANDDNDANTNDDTGKWSLCTSCLLKQSGQKKKKKKKKKKKQKKKKQKKKKIRLGHDQNRLLMCAVLSTRK